MCDRIVVVKREVSDSSVFLTNPYTEDGESGFVEVISDGISKGGVISIDFAVDMARRFGALG